MQERDSSIVIILKKEREKSMNTENRMRGKEEHRGRHNSTHVMHDSINVCDEVKQEIK